MFSSWLKPFSSSTPDIIIEVGPPPFTRFAAHSSLLSQHSGFLRSAIRPNITLTNTMEQQIYIPNVTSEHFTPLLTYMYTGFLDLTMENIFGVLLATHVLHMPRALELCRVFLSQTQLGGHVADKFMPMLNTERNSKTVTIIRPIASKATGSGIKFIAPPTSHIVLPSRETLFKSITIDMGKTFNTHSPTNSMTSNDHFLRKTSEINKHKTIHMIKKQKQQMLYSPVTIHSKEIENNNKAIIDVASCDGPVRFRRVLNNAYGKNSSNIFTQKERSQRIVNLSFHQQMARNITERCKLSEELENSQDSNQNDIFKSRSDEIYNCIYCNHTFKSEYCYKKHANRHLNPLSLNDDQINSGGELSDKEETPDSMKSFVRKREVKPLDMNVQYYPCKTCGSKFPSYYFVHKHRKLYHANEETNQP